MAENEITIRFRVDETGAVRAFDTLDNKLDAVTESAETADRGFSKFQAGLVSLNAAVNLASTAFAAAATGMGAIVNAAREGSTVDDIANSFANLSKQAGISAEVLLNDLNRATEETISNTELMKIANQALLAGLDPSAFDEVAQAARAYADSVGGDAKQELEAFISGLARGDDRFLKSRGILIDNEKAFRDFADSIGTTTDKLTELGKAEALKAAATQALIANTEKLGTANKDIADSIDTVVRRFTDMRDEIFRAIATNVDLKQAFDDLGAAMKQIPVKELAAALSTLVTVLVKVTSASITMGKALRDAVELAFVPYNFFSRKITESQEAQAIAMAEATKAITTQTSVLAPLRAGFQNVVDAVGNFVTKVKPGLISTSKVTEEYADKVKKLREEIQKANSINGLLGFQSELEKVRKAHEDGAISGDRQTQAIRQIYDEMVRLKVPGEDIARILNAAFAPEKIKESAEELGTFADEFAKVFSGDFGSIGGGLGQGVAEGLQNAIAQGISGQFKTSNGIKQGLESLGATIGSEFGPIGEAVGAQLGKLTFDLFHSSDSPGTTFRKEVDKFFADAFEANRLQVIIDGAIQEIGDLDFGGSGFGDPDSGFFAVFDGLDQAARESFKGIAAGFSELTGQGQEFANNLAAALATNVGGSLNNLQLLVQATGKSFEELKGGIQEAFLDGKLSALEAQTALNGLARVAEKGIPDALGAVEQAFENIKAAGVNGGRALIDALQDVGFEAKELGLTTFAQLQERLAATGKFSAGEIQQVFNALAANGIDTIEELTSAGLDPLLATLSQLQAEDFGFAAAVESAQELVDQVNKIPDRLEKTLIFNLKTNADAATQQAQRDGFIPNNAVGSRGPGLAT